MTRGPYRRALEVGADQLDQRLGEVADVHGAASATVSAAAFAAPYAVMGSGGAESA